MTAGKWDVTANDKSVLRRLGERIADFSRESIMETRKSEWKKLNSLESERPMILIDTGGMPDEVVPLSSLECESEFGRTLEQNLRERLFHYEVVKDDMIAQPWVTYSHFVESTDYGVTPVVHQGDNGKGHGSRVWEPPIKDLAKDFSKLKFRTFKRNDDASAAYKAALDDVFDGVLSIKKKNWCWWSQGITSTVIDLIGLQQLMIAMCDQPDELHRLMAFMRDEYAQTLDLFEKQGWLTLNNEDDNIGSGSIGYTDELPKSDRSSETSCLLIDMWGLSESQETVGVSPAMFEEFVFPYQLPLISRFGLSYYGCCEAVHNRWHVIKRIPNLRKVSISPWCDEEKMAGFLGRDYVYCRKPNPTSISTERWDEDLIREDIRKTIVLTRGMNVEFVMKDVHTINNQPWRVGRWVEIVREEIDSHW